MTEEEQLSMAIQESLGKKTEIVYLDEDSEPKSDTKVASQPTHSPLQTWVKRDEPSSTSPDITHVQFRLPNGQRILRRFLRQDPVTYLFDFLLTEVPSLTNQSIEVSEFLHIIDIFFFKSRKSFSSFDYTL
jgi:hypothetical protein